MELQSTDYNSTQEKNDATKDVFNVKYFANDILIRELMAATKAYTPCYILLIYKYFNKCPCLTSW